MSRLPLAVTVVIPTIERRGDMLARALRSVDAQTAPPAAVIVEKDVERVGAPLTRQRGLERVTTPWVAFLDDDDEFEPFHLEALTEAAVETGADYVYSWFTVVGGTDPFPQHFGRPWDRDNPRATTIVTLVRTDLALEVGGFIVDHDLNNPTRTSADEDWIFTLRMNEAGTIYHLPRRTWRWHHHGTNTSGLPTR